jgi:hypothetical protein
MGDRFYRQQIKATGSCPGFNKPTKKGNRKMAWDDDKRAAVVEAYEKANPTPENSMEIVKQIADDMGESANGVRMVLTKAGVYIKKSEGTAAASSGAAKAATGTRVSKAGAQEAIMSALRDAGQEIDEDVVSKLTGKAAMYFANIITKLNK